MSSASWQSKYSTNKHTNKLADTSGHDVLPNINLAQTAKRAEKCRFVPGNLDFWPWHSNSSERGTKHVLPVNLAQIRSAVSNIFHTQTESHRQCQKTEPYTVSSLHVVMIGFSSQTCSLVTFYAYNFTRPSKYITVLLLQTFNCEE